MAKFCFNSMLSASVSNNVDKTTKVFLVRCSSDLKAPLKSENGNPISLSNPKFEKN